MAYPAAQQAWQRFVIALMLRGDDNIVVRSHRELAVVEIMGEQSGGIWIMYAVCQRIVHHDIEAYQRGNPAHGLSNASVAENPEGRLRQHRLHVDTGAAAAWHPGP